MDWPRAKTLLIVSFLLLDIVLAGFLWARRHGGYEELALAAYRAKQEGQVREELAKAGVKLLGGLPAKVPKRMRRLEVRVEEPDPQALAKAFFRGDTGVVRSEWRGLPEREGGEAEGFVFRRGGERLTVLQQGLVLYERQDLGGASLGAPFDPESARASANEFLVRIGAFPGVPDMIIPVPTNGPPAYQVIYFQRYKRWPIFSAYRGLEVASAGVRTYEQFLVMPVGFSGPQMDVLSPAEVLLRLPRLLGLTGGPPGRAGAAGDGSGTAGNGPASHGGDPRKESLLVERVELGYYSRFDAGARQWEAVPVWLVVMGGGQQYYINAYRGTLEE